MQDIKKVECNKISKCSVSSPVGVLHIAVCHVGIHKVQFGKTSDEHVTKNVIMIKEEVASSEGRARLEECLYWFRQYFAKSPEMKAIFGPPVCRTVFQSSFQHKVLQVLRQQVTFGKVISYGALAELAGKNKESARAVGRAMSSNNIPIVIPCHRVVNTNRKVGKFSGGVSLKTWLLKHEGNDIKDGQVFMTKCDSKTDEQQSAENSDKADTTIDVTSEGNITVADMTVAVEAEEKITEMDSSSNVETVGMNVPENNTDIGFETKKVGILKSEADVNSIRMDKESDMNVDVELTDISTGENVNLNSDLAKEKSNETDMIINTKINEGISIETHITVDTERANEDGNAAERNINVLTTGATSADENIYVHTDSAKEETNEADMNSNVKISEGSCKNLHNDFDTNTSVCMNDVDDVASIKK